MKVILEMDKGPGVGSRFELPAQVYRAIGRSGGWGEERTKTLVVAAGPPSQAEDVVSAHLEGRDRVEDRCTVRAVQAAQGSFRRGADILVEDHLTSRTHAMVFVDDDGPSVVDLGSTNGTFVNARAVTDADLVDGDVIRIGSAQFIVRVESAA